MKINTTTKTKQESKKPAVKKADVSKSQKTKKVAKPKQEKKIIKKKEAATKKVEKKITVDPKIAETKTDEKAAKKIAYYYAIGRRKCAIAQVRLYKKGEGEIKINEQELKNYFPREEWQSTVSAPLNAMGQTNKLNVHAKVRGGGVKSQTEAVRLGIARALLKLNPIFKRGLKKYGYLTRDSRVKERKKYGLKRARRAPQWQKR